MHKLRAMCREMPYENYPWLIYCRAPRSAVFLGGSQLKLKQLLFAVLLLGIVSGAWVLQGYISMESARRDVLMMDTFVSVLADGRQAEKVLDDAIVEMQRLEALLSAHVAGSDVYRINNARGEQVSVSAETIEVLAVAEEAFRKSNGAFDVTIGAVLKLWGFGTDDRRVPSAAELLEVMAGVGFANVEFSREDQWVRLKHPGTRLDFGGVAKGYIVDRAAEFISSRGIRHAVVDAGGDVRIVGGRPNIPRWRGARPARVGVQDPVTRANLIAVVSVMDAAVLTSGDYERYFMEDGVRYSHIIDPRTGRPVQGLSSVTIVASKAAVADALATAVMVLGPEAGMSLIEALDGVEALLITAEQELIMSSGMAALTEVLR